MNRPLCLLAAILVVGACAGPAAHVSAGSSSAPGTADSRPPTEVTEAASAVKGYRYKVTIELLPEGRFRRTTEERYELLSASPHRYYARLETEFDPDEDDRPELSATVTLPGGGVAHLDPATVAETPAEGPGEDNLTSRRRLVGPLPSLVAGAVVDRRTSTLTARPRLDVGRVFSHPLAMSLPVDELTFVLDHPVDQPVLTRVLQAEVTPRREEQDGRVRITWTRTGVPGVQHEATLPPEERRFPTVMVSTAAGWPQVAQGYLAAVRPMLSSKALGPIARELKPASAAPRDVAAASLDWMHHRLRYTGLDFANAGVIPHTPEETLQRGYGDCKDLAAFLVALLEASGVPSRMVLVHTADWHDDADELAGLNRFDHAIVMVPGPTPLWIDPTLRGLPPGTLSGMTMARMALVIDPSTTALTKTPVGRASENRAVVHREITLPAYGPGAVKTVRTSTGTVLSWPRFRAQMRSADQLNKQVAEEVSETHDTKVFTYRHSDPLAVTPFEDVLEVEASNRSLASDLDAVAQLGFEAILDAIPDAVEGVPEDGAEAEGISGPIFVGAPRTLELITRVRVSPLFELRGGPISRQGEVGQVRWTYQVDPRPDGAEARMQVTFGARAIPADEVQRVRLSMETLLSSGNSLEFANRPMRLMEDGKLLEAVRELRAMEAKAPRDPLFRALLARAAQRAGLTAEAQALAREARDLGPMQPPVARAVGWLLSLESRRRAVRQGDGA